MPSYFDRVWFAASAGGTGSFTAATAVNGYRTPASAGVSNGAIVTYVAESSDLSQWETGQGTYNSGVISRDTVRASSNAGSAVNFTAPPRVFLDKLAAESTLPVPVVQGGTGATTDTIARNNLGLGIAASPQFTGLSLVRNGGNVLWTTERSDTHGSGQYITLWEAYGRDSAGGLNSYGYTAWEAYDATAGNEDGRFEIAAQIAGNTTWVARFGSQISFVKPIVSTESLTLEMTAPSITFKAAAGANANVIYGKKNNLNRWSIHFPNANLEGSNNVGSDFSISRYRDADGVSLGAALQIYRDDGLMELYGNFTVLTTAAALAQVLSTGSSAQLRVASTNAGSMATLDANPAAGTAVGAFRGLRAGVVQWSMEMPNASDNFSLKRYISGVSQGDVITIDRTTGQITFAGTPIIAAATPTLDTHVTNKTYVDTKGGLAENNTWTNSNLFGADQTYPARFGTINSNGEIIVRYDTPGTPGLLTFRNFGIDGATRGIGNNYVLAKNNGTQYLAAQMFTVSVGTWDTALTSSAVFRFAVMTAGAQPAREMDIGNGIQVGVPSGGAKGVGTLNAIAVYDDNVLLTCYVLDAARTGTVDCERWDGYARRKNQFKHDCAWNFLSRLDELDVRSYARKWRASGVLPGMMAPDEIEPPVGTVLNSLMETCELLAVHCEQLANENDALEARLANLEGAR